MTVARQPRRFFIDQVRKTSRRPWRIVAIPYYYCYRGLRPPIRRTGRALSFLGKQLLKTIRRPQRILPISLHILQLGHRAVTYRFSEDYSRASLATKHYDLGFQFFAQNRSAEAWDSFQRCLTISDNWFHFMIAGACAYVGLGRMRDAIALWSRANELQEATATKLGVRYFGRQRVMDGFWAGAIGHTAMIDYIVKLGILEKRDRRDTILYLPPGIDGVNRFFVEQWAPHLRLVRRTEELPFSAEAAAALRLDFYLPAVTKDSRLHHWELAAKTYRRWRSEGRGPLLALPANVKERGWATLARAGIPRGSWFVGLHVREGGYRQYHRDLHNVLNASVEDYMPAIEEVTRRGGWVVRMGDPTMKPLPAIHQLIDYCHSPIRSDWMDIFLASQCRFFIGTSSGLGYVPQSYGVRCVLTNWWPHAQRPWHADDIFLPKLYRRKRDATYLTLAESLAEPFGFCNALGYLEETKGVVVEDNTPEDILAAVIEMFDRLEDAAKDSSEDIMLRSRAEGIYASVAADIYGSSAAFGAAALARDFLKKHPFLVGSARTAEIRHSKNIEEETMGQNSSSPFRKAGNDA